MTILKHADFEVPEFGEFVSPPIAVPGYAQAVNAMDPLAYWRCGETSGTTLADQTGAHNATLYGNYALGHAGALSTDTNGAVQLYKGEAISSIPVLPGLTSAPFSIVLWVRRYTNDSKSGVLVRQFTTDTTGDLRLILQSDGRIRYLLHGDTDFYSTQTVSTAWRMVVLTRSASGVASWYFDGLLDVANSGCTTAVNAASFIIGQLGSTKPDLLFDEVAAFDSALSVEQIRWLYGLGKGKLNLPTEL